MAGSTIPRHEQNLISPSKIWCQPQRQMRLGWIVLENYHTNECTQNRQVTLEFYVNFTFYVLFKKCVINFTLLFVCGRTRVSSVGIATRYGLEGPGIESRWGEVFRIYPDRLRGPPSLLYNGYRIFPWGKGSRGVMLTTHPLLVPRLRKSWAIPPLTLWVFLGLLRGSLYLSVLFTIFDTKTVRNIEESRINGSKHRR
jgi:hypothetical protein